MIGQATERATALWDQGARWDEILASLRAEGFSKVDCIRATVEIRACRWPTPSGSFTRARRGPTAGRRTTSSTTS